VKLLLCIAAALVTLGCRAAPAGRTAELSLRVEGFVKASGIT
jgi:hypothetical protein